MGDLYNRAYKIALNAHQGQVDKAGVDYFCHPLRVANSFITEKEQVVGILHDVIEDTEITLTDLEVEGFPEDVIVAIELLTKVRGVNYFDYLEKVRSNPLARAVKLADLKDNSDLTRINKPTHKDLARNEKYNKAIDFLS